MMLATYVIDVRPSQSAHTHTLTLINVHDKTWKTKQMSPIQHCRSVSPVTSSLCLCSERFITNFRLMAWLRTATRHSWQKQKRLQFHWYIIDMVSTAEILEPGNSQTKHASKACLLHRCKNTALHQSTLLTSVSGRSSPAAVCPRLVCQDAPGFNWIQSRNVWFDILYHVSKLTYWA